MIVLVPHAINDNRAVYELHGPGRGTALLGRFSSPAELATLRQQLAQANQMVEQAADKVSGRASGGRLNPRMARLLSARAGLMHSLPVDVVYADCPV